MKVREVFASNLGLLCQDYGNYSEVARRLGITRQQLRKHLHAESLPTERTLARMARFFGVEETDLVDPNFRQDSASKDYRYMQHIKSALALSEQPDLPSGRFDLYFSYPDQPEMVLRALVLTSLVEGTLEFRRLTSFYGRDRADWRFYRGDHRGIVLQAAGTTYLCGVNQLPTYEPSLVALEKVATSALLYRGQCMVMNVDGGAVAAAVMTPCSSASLRTALRRIQSLPITSDEVPAIVRRELIRMNDQIAQERRVLRHDAQEDVSRKRPELSTIES